MTSSAATGLGHVISHHTMSSTTTTRYQGVTTIGRDDIYVVKVSLNVGNIGTGNVYSFLMIAGSSYSDLMTGLGYTDMHEREQLCAVFRRLYCLVVDM